MTHIKIKGRVSEYICMCRDDYITAIWGAGRIARRVYYMCICIELYIITYSYGVFSTVFSRLAGRPTAGSQLTGANEVQEGLQVRDVLYRRVFELMYPKEYF